jgi:PAS domain-containing protein
MAQKEIEVILARHLASYLATPIFIVDPEGQLLYYNEHAEQILGVRFEETGEMPISEWGTIFLPTDSEGTQLPVEKLPLAITLLERRPANGSFWIQGLDHVSREIEVFSFPLVGQADRYLGAVAIFWEKEDSERTPWRISPAERASKKGEFA